MDSSHRTANREIDPLRIFIKEKSQYWDFFCILNKKKSKNLRLGYLSIDKKYSIINLMSSVISEEEQKYQEIFESASDGIVVIDLKTNKVLAANPAAAKMHGYEQEAFCGLSLQHFIHTKNLNSFLDLSDVIWNGGVFETVAQHFRSDSTIFNVEWHAVSYRYKGHNCALATLRDISLRIKAEQHLKSRLLEKVREQTTLLEISQILTSSLDLKRGLILDQIKVMVKYSHACRFKFG